MCVCMFSWRSGHSHNQLTSLRPPVVASHSFTQSANLRSEKGHLCLPGLPGDEEEAVVGGVNPVGASFADHDSTTGVSATVAAIVLQKNKQDEITGGAEKTPVTFVK